MPSDLTLVQDLKLRANATVVLSQGALLGGSKVHDSKVAVKVQDGPTSQESKVQPLDETSHRLIAPNLDATSDFVTSKIESTDADLIALDQPPQPSKMSADSACAPIRAKLVVDFQTQGGSRLGFFGDINEEFDSMNDINQYHEEEEKVTSQNQGEAVNAAPVSDFMKVKLPDINKSRGKCNYFDS